ncbi:MAG: hypothetical protein KDD56_09005 [Bdellovibrionales bacterium]|nr:hypothetical protein [Bdellovibrionales bacterium]
MLKFSPLFFVFLIGCAGLNTGPAYEYEVINSDQIALEEIQATPTQFILEGAKSSQAWERGRIFLNKYLKGTEYSIVARGQDSVERMESKINSSSNYKYRIERIRLGDDYQFSVVCSPLKNQANSMNADLNARNLSRFIKDGTLELTQLVR